jgi:hypothetical protein
MDDEQIEEMGPVDYLVLEWPGDTPVTGAVMAELLDLVDRDVIRVLDLAFLAKGDDGSVAALDLAGLAQGDAALAEFADAASGLIGPEDLEDAASALEPGTVAGVLIWENRWAAPIAVAMRRSGGALIASGRVPVQAILASLEATEAIN